MATSALAATPEVEQPRVGLYPSQFWGNMELQVGMVAGLYAPLREYSSDFDCFSQWVNLANNFVSASRIYDGGFSYK